MLLLDSVSLFPVCLSIHTYRKFSWLSLKNVAVQKESPYHITPSRRPCHQAASSSLVAQQGLKKLVEAWSHFATCSTCHFHELSLNQSGYGGRFCPHARLTKSFHSNVEFEDLPRLCGSAFAQCSATAGLPDSVPRVRALQQPVQSSLKQTEELSPKISEVSRKGFSHRSTR